MKAALVSRGARTFPLYPGRDGFDAVVAVNSAAERVVADYWAVPDIDEYLLEAPHERPGNPIPCVRTLPEMDGHLQTCGNPDLRALWQTQHRGRCLARDVINAVMPEFPPEIPRSPTGGARWCKFGGTFGLGICWYLHTISGDARSTVVCYGADVDEGSAEVPNIDGHLSPEERWHLERLIWAGEVAAFEEHGLTVEVARCP